MSEIRSLKWTVDNLETKYWELSRLHDELVEHLMLTHDKKSISRYIRKGGPEQAP